MRIDSRLRYQIGLMTVGCLLLGSLTGCVFGLGKKGKVNTDIVQDASLENAGSWDEKMLLAKQQALVAPWDPYWLYVQGALYTSADSLFKAETMLKRSLSRKPDYDPAVSLLSKLYYDTGRHDDGIQLLESRRARGGAVPEGIVGALSLHYHANGQVDQAMHLTRGLTTETVSPVPAYVLLQGDSFRDAAAPAAEAVKSAPDNAVNQNNYGITRLQAGDPVAAREAFFAAVTLDPFLTGPLYNLAILERFYFMNESEGKKWFDRYWELSQEDPDGLREVFYPSALLETDQAGEPEDQAATQEDRP